MSKSKILGLMALITFAMGIFWVGEAVAGERENLIVIERNLHEIWHQQKFAVVEEIVAEDYVRHLPGGQEVRGQKGYFEEHVKPNMAFNWRFNMDLVIPKGDYVVVRYSNVGTDPATGKRIKGSSIVIHRLKDGKMVECWAEWDALSVFQQLGYQLVPPEK